jgi:hypothetical protein
VDQATFGGGVGGVSHRPLETEMKCRQESSSVGEDHSNGRTGTTAIRSDGQHAQPQPPRPRQHDFDDELDAVEC